MWCIDSNQQEEFPSETTESRDECQCDDKPSDLTSEGTCHCVSLPDPESKDDNAKAQRNELTVQDIGGPPHESTRDLQKFQGASQSSVKRHSKVDSRGSFQNDLKNNPVFEYMLRRGSKELRTEEQKSYRNSVVSLGSQNEMVRSSKFKSKSSQVSSEKSSMWLDFYF